MQLSQAAKDAGAKMQETLKGMDDDAITKLAEDQVKEGKGADPKKEKPKSPDEAEAKTPR